MGIASADVTGDGYPEVFLTSQGDNKLQTLAAGPGRPTYEDIALSRGVTAHRPFAGGDVLPSTAWHDQFADVNNDGFTDLFIAKGNVDAEEGYATRDPSNLLIGRADGTFVEGAEAAGILSYDRARGAALVDLNLDGMLDLVVVHRTAPVALWRNVGRGDAEQPEPMGSWVAIRLHQPTANVDGVGAWIETRVGDRTTVHEVTVGGGHASGQLGWIHIGVGSADQAEVRVQWPDGETGPWMTLDAGEPRPSTEARCRRPRGSHRRRIAPTDGRVAGEDVSSRTLVLGTSTYPVILPSTRDPRLHVAAVIITIHVLGQVGLGFHVSVPQILAAILTCAVLEVALTFRARRAFVWPASAMLTGSGVALILRVPGTPDEAWSTHKWYLFAGIAAFSLLTKYVIRYRGTHLFNPSNIGLVVAFVVLGSQRIEPLDFWWAPLNGWMILAYAVILGGGPLITRRLHLLAAAATFWIALAVGVGVLAAAGHCITARSAFAPVCGFDYWRVIVTSPEVLIFLFFMITDPKTVPAGRVGRVAFGLLVAVASTLLMAPQTDEFGTKVALLGGLVVVCASRPLIDRLAPAATIRRRPAGPVRRSAGDRRRPTHRRGRRRQRRVVAAAVVAVGVAVVVAGSPARGTPVLAADDVLGRVPDEVDAATFPEISVEQDVSDWNHEIAGPVARELVLNLAENLELETQALLRADATILTAVDYGDRLDATRVSARWSRGDGRDRHRAVPDRRRQRDPAGPVRQAGRPEPGPRVEGRSPRRRTTPMDVQSR